MKAIVVDRFGSPDVLKLKDVEEPARKEGEVSVKIYAASVNPLDTVLRKGISMGSYTPSLPYTPGFGIAGVVNESDKSSRFNAGDRVWGNKHSAGGYAEYAVYQENDLEILPDELSFYQGAIIDTPFRTSFWSLFDLGEAKRGEVVVITGASGSVGHACVQVANSAGLRVIALCGGRDLERVSALGVDAVFDYRRSDLHAALERHLAGEFAQIFVDVAAVQNVALAAKVLGPGGKHIVVGPGGNTPIAVDPFALIEKGLKICGVALYTSSPQRHSEISKAISDGFHRGEFHVLEPEKLPLKDAIEAHAMLESGKNAGKLVLAVN